MKTKRITYAKRAEFCQHPLAKKLFHLLDEKKTNLALSADVTHCADVLHLAETLGPEICVLKTHVDILTDFTPEFINELTQLAERHQFFIFEDRKFADIGHTVKHQYADGIYHIADWAHFINAHSLPGPGIIAGLATVGLEKQRGLLLIAEMSSEKNLLDLDYTVKTVAMAEQFPEFVLGFIAQHKLSHDPRWIHFTPGVQFAVTNDALGQQYITPQAAIHAHNTDIIIVGRGITRASDPLAAAKQYRQAAWDAYYSFN